MMRTDTGMDFSLNRVSAMVRRYWYLLRSSWPRILDLIYWPTVQMLMWGFLQVYISQNAGFFARAGGVFIGSVLLWDILFADSSVSRFLSLRKCTRATWATS
jgi:ABC-2 type transport system permease protein